MNAPLVNEAQIKFIRNRINNVEDHFGLMCYSFSQVASEDAGLRDSVDDLARTLVAFADKEVLNRTMRTQVTHLADILCAVADIQNDLVQNVEMKVVGGFMSYKDACRIARNDFKTLLKAQKKESKMGRKLNLGSEKALSDVKQADLADGRLHSAIHDVNRAGTALGESVQHFEVRKMRDLQKFLLEFCHSELTFHARCVELYTRAFNDIEEIQIESDVNEFKKAMMFQSGTHDGVNRSRSNVNAFQRGRPFGQDERLNYGNKSDPMSSSRHAPLSSQHSFQNPRSHSLDRDYGSRLRMSPRDTRDTMHQSYGEASWSGGYEGGLRSVRSRSK